MGVKLTHLLCILLAALMVPAAALGQFGPGSGQTEGPFGSGPGATSFAVTATDAGFGGFGGIAGFFFRVQLLDPVEIPSLTVTSLGGAPLVLSAGNTSTVGTAWLPQGPASASGINPLTVLNLQFFLTNTTNTDTSGDIAIFGTPIVHLNNFLVIPPGGFVSRVVYGGTPNNVTVVTNPTTQTGGLALTPSNFVLSSQQVTASVNLSHRSDVIPEPATMTLLGGGLAFLIAGLAFRRRRRKEA